MLNGNKKNITIIAVAVLNLLLTIGAITVLDKMLPLKFYAQNPFKMVGKGVLLILPVVILVLSALQVFYRIKTIKKPVNTFRRVEDAVFVCIIGLLMIINWVFVCVGKDNTGTKEQFDNGLELCGEEIGFRYQTNEELTMAMMEVERLDEDKRKKIECSALKTVMHFYTEQASVNNVYDFYQHILNK